VARTVLDLAPAQWAKLEELAIEVIESRSKDLEIVAYLLEAVARRHQFAGLRDGFRLARELIERYWESLYPRPDEEGVATRVAALSQLNGIEADGTLIAPIKLIPITNGRGELFTTWHFENASHRDAVRAAGDQSDAAWIQGLAEDLAQCLVEFDLLEGALTQRCGQDGPPTSKIREALVQVETAVREVGGAHLKPAGDAASENAGAAGGEGGSGAGGPVGSREEALRKLREVAEYFRRHEPHSPVSYAIDRSIRWAKLPLHELLGELIPNKEAFKEFDKRTGISPPSKDKDEE
jgi:type VI secretion system protein ImpA